MHDQTAEPRRTVAAEGKPQCVAGLRQFLGLDVGNHVDVARVSTPVRVGEDHRVDRNARDDRHSSDVADVVLCLVGASDDRRRQDVLAIGLRDQQCERTVTEPRRESLHSREALCPPGSLTRIPLQQVRVYDSREHVLQGDHICRVPYRAQFRSDWTLHGCGLFPPDSPHSCSSDTVGRRRGRMERLSTGRNERRCAWAGIHATCCTMSVR